jgi:hypothetical protein
MRGKDVRALEKPGGSLPIQKKKKIREARQELANRYNDYYSTKQTTTCIAEKTYTRIEDQQRKA